MYIQIFFQLISPILFVDSQHSQPLLSSFFSWCFYIDPLNTWRISAFQYFSISENDLPVQVKLSGSWCVIGGRKSCRRKSSKNQRGFLRDVRIGTWWIKTRYIQWQNSHSPRNGSSQLSRYVWFPVSLCIIAFSASPNFFVASYSTDNLFVL